MFDLREEKEKIKQINWSKYHLNRILFLYEKQKLPSLQIAWVLQQHHLVWLESYLEEQVPDHYEQQVLHPKAP